MRKGNEFPRPALLKFKIIIEPPGATDVSVPPRSDEAVSMRMRMR